MSSHPKHPKCPSCNRSMYKTMTKGRAVSKTDPWAYCRNAKCEIVGQNQSGELSIDERKDGKTAPEPKPEFAACGDCGGDPEHLEDCPKIEAADETEDKGSYDAVADGTVGEGDEAGEPAEEAEPKPKKKKGKKAKAKKGKKSKELRTPPKKKGKAKKPKDEPAEEAPEAEEEAPEESEPTKPPSRAKGKKKSKKAKAKAAEDAASEGNLDELLEGRTDKFGKAATRIQGALADDGSFSRNICELALSMATKADGPEAAAELITYFKLDEKYGITPPSPA